jgi:mRNA interferase RelE/StbE
LSYTVLLSERARKQLHKLDKPAAAFIYGWLKKNIDGCDNPRAFGKALTGNRNSQWRYRIGSYRAICLIQDDKLTVLAIEIGHRKDVYD